MRILKIMSLVVLMMAVMPMSVAHAFCGFYVARADADLFNEASKVVMSRHDDKTVMTMVNDYQGDITDFAVVIPVPEVPEEGQIHVTENALVDHLDAYTAPRLVEYFDEDPCRPIMYKNTMMRAAPMAMMEDAVGGAQSAKALGVTIEAEYTVGEYDISILSAKQSGGLLTWLNQEGYKLPNGATKILGSYIKQDLKFFVAKVNLKQQQKLGYSYLRPLQVAYSSDRFMLPIRLGTLNAKGDQEIILMTLTEKGRVETTNYRTVKIPSNMDIPIFVKDEFGDFYKAMFSHAVDKERKKAVFLEYAWNMAWCDPCAADPLSAKDLRTLGAWWVKPQDVRPIRPVPMPSPQPRVMPIQPRPQDVFVTRLHLRYTADTFPEDLMLQVTNDKENYQGRYVLRHPWKGDASCQAADQYRRELPKRFDKEAKNLARLTGWNINDIRQKMEQGGQSVGNLPKPTNKKWWDGIWND